MVIQIKAKHEKDTLMNESSLNGNLALPNIKLEFSNMTQYYNMAFCNIFNYDKLNLKFQVERILELKFNLKSY